MRFVPDEQPAGGLRFVPDEPEAKKKTSLTDELGRQSKEALGGVFEPLLAMGSGAIAKPVSDIAGMGAAAASSLGFGGPPEPRLGADPSGFQRHVQESLTYQPRTSAGASPYNPLNAIPGGLGKLIEMIAGGAGRGTEWAGEKLGVSPAVMGPVRSGVEEAFKQAPQLAGVKGGAAMAERLPLKQAGLDIAKGERSVADATRDTAQASGYITPPERGLKSAAAGLAGKAKVEKIISQKNADTATRNLGREVGLPEGVALSDEVRDGLKEAQYARYDAMKDAVGPELQVTNGFRESLSKTLTSITNSVDVNPSLRPAQRIINGFLRRIGPEDPALQPRPGKGAPPIMGTIEKAATEQPGPRIARTIEQAAAETPGPKAYGSMDLAPPRSVPIPTGTIPTLSTEWVMKQISDLRRNAKDDFARRDSDSGIARLGVANQLENLFEENIAKKGPQQLADFRDARKTLAQLHFLDRVVNEATGQVDLAKVASLSETKAYKGVLTGAFKDAADFAKAYRKAAQKPTGEAAPRLTVFDGMFAAAALGSMHPGMMGAAATELAGRLAIPGMAERGMMQNRTPNYQPGAVSRSLPSGLPVFGAATSEQANQGGFPPELLRLLQTQAQ